MQQISALRKDALRSFEASVNMYQSISRHIPRDSTFHSHCRENPKSHRTIFLVTRFPPIRFPIHHYMIGFLVSQIDRKKVIFFKGARDSRAVFEGISYSLLELNNPIS
jgi:hypothetical protein